MCEVMEKYMAESRAEGKAEGKVEQLVELVEKGLLKLADAADVIGMSEEEFKHLLDK